MPISITFVITTLGPAGAEGMLCRLLSGLDRTRFNAKVITLIDLGETSNIRKIRAMGIPVISLGMQPGRPDPFSVLRLVRWLRKDRPDLVSTWLYHADLIGGLAAWMAGRLPIAWSLRQSDLDRESSKRLTFLTVRICAWLSRVIPKRIICCAESVRQLHESLGYAAGKMVVVPNGYDLDTFSPDSAARAAIRAELGISNETTVIGLVARFHPQKDHRNFLRAAQLIHDSRPDVSFVLCGHDADVANRELVGWIQEARLGKHVHLLGPRDDVSKVTAAFDLACLSSAYGEGFPNVVSEAMSCAVPCVVTDVGEAAFIVGNTGRVVQPRDPEALARALLELVELGSEGRSRLGDAARKRIKEHFNLPLIVKQYERVFEEIVCGNGPSHYQRLHAE